MEVISTGPRDPEKGMDFWYSSEKWKVVLGADSAETIRVPPNLDVLKSWKRESVDEAPHLAPNILGQKGEAAFMQKFQELNMGGILVSGLEFCDLEANLSGRKKDRKVKKNQKIQDGEWDAIFFHKNRGIFVIEVKATETNDENIVNKRIGKAKSQLNRNIEMIKHSFHLLYKKECICITGFICFPFRNEDRDTYEGYRVIDKSALNDRAIFRKFFEPQTNDRMIEISLLRQFAAEFVCCRSQVEFHSQAYNAMQVATWIMEQDIAQKQDPTKTLNMPGNGPSGKIILTAQQLEIVECKEKCITICGAPGSGKTLILMLRALEAAMENKPGSVFVFVNEKLKAKYEKYFFEEKDKIIWDRARKIDRRPKVHTIDMINFAEPTDDVFFDETPVEDYHIKEIQSRVNCSGNTTVVITGLHKPGEAVTSFRLYQRRLEEFKHFELMKMLRGTRNIFEKWEHYYTHGITMGHGIDGVAVKSDIFDSFDQVQNEIANKIDTLTSANISTAELPSLKKEHIAVITCDDNDSIAMRNYFDAKKIPCGQVNEQARMSSSNVAVDVYLNTPSYEWPIVFIILKPGIIKEEVLPIAASRCIASLTIFTYENVTQPSPVNLKRSLGSIQNSLRRIYSKSYRNVIPLSLPFYFDIDEKWVNLTLILEGGSTVTEDYATLLKKAFAKADMLIIEGDPGVGKSSLMQRLAYEWTQSRWSDYDLVLHIELRRLREFEFKDIKELVSHYMKGYLDEEDYEIFHQFINDSKCCKEHKIIVLLDGYDESALEEQCQELSDFFSSSISRPLQFNVLITSRKGYLSKHRNQGRFIFVDIIGFTTELQKQEYISKHFKAVNNTESSENTSAVTHLLNTNGNLEMLSESPLMLTFICLLHKKIIDGTEVELYMNMIWWMIDRHQRSNPNQNVSSLFDYEHDETDKFRVIENNYQYFPQLHMLGIMAMQDIFKTTFTDTDLKKFELKEIVQEVGFLRKEETRDTSYHTKTEYSFLHRTIQEFIMALTFFFSYEEPPENFGLYVLLLTRESGYGIIPAKIQTFFNMIYSSKIKKKGEKNILSYSQFMEFSTQLSSHCSSNLEHSSNKTIDWQGHVVDLSIETEQCIPKSSAEAIKMVLNEAEQGDAFTQFKLGLMYHLGILIDQSDKEAAKWYRKSAEQQNARAQLNLGEMYKNGEGVVQSDEDAIKWYRKAAEQGNPSAQFNLGFMYENGKGVSQSNEEAVKWYRKSAEQGDAIAQYNLGLMYMDGIGVTQSDEEAAKWCRESANQGNAHAQCILGLMHMSGKGVPQSDEEAVKRYRESANQGYADAKLDLALMYMNGRGVPQSDAIGIKYCLTSSEQGNAKAQFNLGKMYMSGESLPQSVEEAVKWYRKSAEQGNASAQYNLGNIYQQGKGVPQSNEEAVKWYRKAAEQEDSNAQFYLGVMYEKGKGVPQSDEEATKWLRKSAEQGRADAQNNLGLMYLKGRGVPQSEEEAVKWYTKAAEQGDANAQFNLGLMYEKGKGVPQSDEEAVKWYTKSAERGNAEAQCDLGLMYENGRGVPQSNEEAVRWYSESTKQGNSKAQYHFGLMYRKGKSVPQTNKEAFKWFRISAEQGERDGQYYLGYMYKKGKGIRQSDQEAVKWFSKSAEQENADAQFQLGCMYQNGRGVPQSDEEAVKWYTKAAEQGNATAQFNIGFMCENGRGMPQSDEEAVKWYRMSAEQGDARAQSYLGYLYQNGRGVLQSHGEAVKWYKKSAEQGDGNAQYSLGLMYENGQGVPQSYEEAVRWYIKSANQGNSNVQFCLRNMYKNGKGVSQTDEEIDIRCTKLVEQGKVDAQCSLGFMHENGEGIPQSSEEAVKWYRKAANQGDASAQFILGKRYEDGKGVHQSYRKAIVWFKKSAEQGNALAQYSMGSMYVKGRGTPQSEEEAVKWYRKSAEQGYALAQCDLGLMYENGRGVPQSNEEAVEWYRRAAEQGYDNAQDNLGCMYQKGKGMPKSDEEAVEWYRKAAEQGYANAQDHLGDMYHYGEGVPQSHEEAYKWFKKAADQGHEGAKTSLSMFYKKNEVPNWYGRL